MGTIIITPDMPPSSARPALCLQIHALLAFDNCQLPGGGRMCLRLSWVMIVATVTPFVMLVMIDGMIMYHVSVYCNRDNHEPPMGQARSPHMGVLRHMDVLLHMGVLRHMVYYCTTTYGRIAMYGCIMTLQGMT